MTGNTYRGRFQDGTEVSVTIRDLGIRDRCRRGLHFKVYTTQIKLDSGETHYSRVDRMQADMTGNAVEYRLAEDRLALERLGIRGII